MAISTVRGALGATLGTVAATFNAATTVVGAVATGAVIMGSYMDQVRNDQLISQADAALTADDDSANRTNEKMIANQEHIIAFLAGNPVRAELWALNEVRIKEARAALKAKHA